MSMPENIEAKTDAPETAAEVAAIEQPAAADALLAWRGAAAPAAATTPSSSKEKCKS